VARERATACRPKETKQLGQQAARVIRACCRIEQGRWKVDNPQAELHKAELCEEKEASELGCEGSAEAQRAAVEESC